MKLMAMFGRTYIVIFKNVGRGKAGYTNPMSIECDTGHLRTQVLKASIQTEYMKFHMKTTKACSLN